MNAGEQAARFARIHFVDESHLFEIVLATRAARGLAGAGESGQKDRGQNADDGDDHQQFNECESAGLAGSLISRRCRTQ